jgi:hypothetical protein
LSCRPAVVGVALLVVAPVVGLVPAVVGLVAVVSLVDVVALLLCCCCALLRVAPSSQSHHCVSCCVVVKFLPSFLPSPVVISVYKLVELLLTGKISVHTVHNSQKLVQIYDPLIK